MKKYQLVLEYTDVKYSFPNTVTVNTLLVKTPEGKILIELKGMVSEVKIQGVLKKKMHITKLSLNEAYILAEEDEKGRKQIMLFSYFKKRDALGLKKDKGSDALSFSVQRFMAEKIIVDIKKNNQSVQIISNKLNIATSQTPKAILVNLKMDSIIYPVNKYLDIKDIKLAAKFENEILYVNSVSLKLRDSVFFKANLKYPFIEDGVLSASFDINIYEDNLSGQFAYQPKKQSIISSYIKLSEIKISNLLKIFGKVQPQSEGVIDGNIHFSGSISSPMSWNFENNLRITKSKYSDKILSDLSLSANIINGILNANIKQSETTIELTGSVEDKQNIELKFKVIAPKIEETLKLFDLNILEGSLQGTGNIKGSFDDPKIDCDFSGSKLLYINIPVDLSKSVFQYRKGELYIQSLQIMGISELSSIQNSFISAKNISGSFSYNLNISGPAKSPEGDIALFVESPIYENMTFEHFSIDGVLKNEMLNIKKFELISHKYQVNYEGSILYNEKKGSGRIFVDTYNDEKNRIRFLKTDISFVVDKILMTTALDNAVVNIKGLNNIVDSKSDFDGKVRLSVDLELEQNRPRCTLNLDAVDVQRDDMRIDFVHANMKYEPGNFTIQNMMLKKNNDSLNIYSDLALETKDGKIIGMSKTSDSKFSINGRVDLQYIPLFINPNPVMAGNAIIDVKFNGTLHKPDVLGSLKIDKGFYGTEKKSASIENMSLEILFEGEKTNIKNISFESLGNIVHLNGLFSLKDIENYDFNLNAKVNERELIQAKANVRPSSLELDIKSQEINISLFQPFLRSVKNMSGKAKLSLNVHGKKTSPIVSGFLNGKNINLITKSEILDITEGIIDISFENEKIKFERLKAGLNEGLFELSGFTDITNKGLANTNIDLKLSNNQFNIPGILKSRLHKLQLSLTQTNDRYKLSGEISPGKIEFTKNVDLETSIKKNKSKIVKKPPEILSKIDLEIKVFKSESLVIKNNLGKLNLGIEFRVIGTGEIPAILGKAYILDGYVYYLDRVFDIKKGNIDMTDPLKINPYIDIIAASSIRSYKQDSDIPYKITLTLQGYSKTLSATLSSVPPLSEPDIVSLITIGAISSQLTSSSPSDGIAGAAEMIGERLGSVSSRRISNYLSANVGNMLNLDNVDINGNILKIGSAGGPSLRATKKMTKTTALTYINNLDGSAGAVQTRRTTEKTELVYDTGIGQTNEQRVRLGYKLSRHFMFQSDTNRVGNSGISLKYSLWKK